MDGSAINIYCGENKYCDSNQNCVACTGTDNPCVGQTQSQKNVFGFYFYWYDSGQDNNNYKICGPTYNSSYGYYSCSDPAKINQCSQKSTLEQTPIFGENNNIKWNNKDMYKADFIRMKRAGIDTGILVGWPQEPYDTAALPIMNQALDELKSEGQEFPKFVLFEALDNWIYKLFPEINFNDVNSRKTLINKMATRDIAIWSGLKDEYQYTKDGKKILWFFRPPEIYNSKINCQFFDEFKQELTTRGYNTFLWDQVLWEIVTPLMPTTTGVRVTLLEQIKNMPLLPINLSVQKLMFVKSLPDSNAKTPRPVLAVIKHLKIFHYLPVAMALITKNHGIIV